MAGYYRMHQTEKRAGLWGESRRAFTGISLMKVHVSPTVVKGRESLDAKNPGSGGHFHPGPLVTRFHVSQGGQR